MGNPLMFDSILSIICKNATDICLPYCCMVNAGFRFFFKKTKQKDQVIYVYAISSDFEPSRKIWFVFFFFISFSFFCCFWQASCQANWQRKSHARTFNSTSICFRFLNTSDRNVQMELTLHSVQRGSLVTLFIDKNLIN